MELRDDRRRGEEGREGGTGGRRKNLKLGYFFVVDLSTGWVVEFFFVVDFIYILVPDCTKIKS